MDSYVYTLASAHNRATELNREALRLLRKVRRVDPTVAHVYKLLLEQNKYLQSCQK